MKKHISIFAALFGLSFFSSSAWAAGGNYFGFNAGIGLPYLQQVGLNYVSSSGMFSYELGYNQLELTAEATSSSGSTSAVTSIEVGLTKLEFTMKWHPFSGAFFLGLGLGQQSLYSKADETILSESVHTEVEIKSSTITPKVGWLWGISDGGFFLGLDFGYQSPSGAKSTITTTASSAIQATDDYQDFVADVNDEAEDLGEVGFPTITFIRFGYLF